VAWFSCSIIYNGQGYGDAIAQFGQSIRYPSISFDNSVGIEFDFTNSSTISCDRQTYNARFHGNASATSSVSAFAPYDTGSVIVPAPVQGSFTACLVTLGLGSAAPCNSTLPTYTRFQPARLYTA
jgi:hypothetical protein